VTHNSSAARVKLSVRAAASKARSAFNGGKRRGIGLTGRLDPGQGTTARRPDKTTRPSAAAEGRVGPAFHEQI
jgi:hypothetical protein